MYSIHCKGYVRKFLCLHVCLLKRAFVLAEAWSLVVYGKMCILSRLDIKSFESLMFVLHGQAVAIGSCYILNTHRSYTTPWASNSVVVTSFSVLSHCNLVENCKRKVTWSSSMVQSKQCVHYYASKATALHTRKLAMFVRTRLSFRLTE